jgi:hypothetical protein
LLGRAGALEMLLKPDGRSKCCSSLMLAHKTQRRDHARRNH